jgi:hypothetical protein
MGQALTMFARKPNLPMLAPSDWAAVMLALPLPYGNRGDVTLRTQSTWPYLPIRKSRCGNRDDVPICTQRTRPYLSIQRIAAIRPNNTNHLALPLQSIKSRQCDQPISVQLPASSRHQLCECGCPLPPIAQMSASYVAEHSQKGWSIRKTKSFITRGKTLSL